MRLMQCEIFQKCVIYLRIYKEKNSKTSKNRLFLVIKLDPYSWHYFGKAEKKIKSYSVPDLEYPILDLIINSSIKSLLFFSGNTKFCVELCCISSCICEFHYLFLICLGDSFCGNSLRITG